MPEEEDPVVLSLEKRVVHVLPTEAPAVQDVAGLPGIYPLQLQGRLVIRMYYKDLFHLFFTYILFSHYGTQSSTPVPLKVRIEVFVKPFFVLHILNGFQGGKLETLLGLRVDKLARGVRRVRIGFKRHRAVVEVSYAGAFPLVRVVGDTEVDFRFKQHQEKMFPVV